jgi:hypothetical protein
MCECAILTAVRPCCSLHNQAVYTNNRPCEAALASTPQKIHVHTKLALECLRTPLRHNFLDARARPRCSTGGSCSCSLISSHGCMYAATSLRDGCLLLPSCNMTGPAAAVGPTKASTCASFSHHQLLLSSPASKLLEAAAEVVTGSTHRRIVESGCHLLQQLRRPPRPSCLGHPTQQLHSPDTQQQQHSV